MYTIYIEVIYIPGFKNFAFGTANIWSIGWIQCDEFSSNRLYDVYKLIRESVVLMSDQETPLAPKCSPLSANKSSYI